MSSSLHKAYQWWGKMEKKDYKEGRKGNLRMTHMLILLIEAKVFMGMLNLTKLYTLNKSAL